MSLNLKRELLPHKTFKNVRPKFLFPSRISTASTQGISISIDDSFGIRMNRNINITSNEGVSSLSSGIGIIFYSTMETNPPHKRNSWALDKFEAVDSSGRRNRQVNSLSTLPRYRVL
ncbi:hypothetical protein CDAR_211271 [Caerostris darwini]|uniref:Uncharacterized protein n=1 Tax=Caerostris darwini TaxID=1538125 RepID=A0AAV4VYB3_9ARAC|nr:hypothetical protein CDAR_211271 [Caerostris darwini]